MPPSGLRAPGAGPPPGFGPHPARHSNSEDRRPPEHRRCSIPKPRATPWVRRGPEIRALKGLYTTRAGPETAFPAPDAGRCSQHAQRPESGAGAVGAASAAIFGLVREAPAEAHLTAQLDARESATTSATTRRIPFKASSGLRCAAPRRGDRRVCLWLPDADYLVDLAKRSTYTLLWTAYPVGREHAPQGVRRDPEKLMPPQRTASLLLLHMADELLTVYKESRSGARGTSATLADPGRDAAGRGFALRFFGVPGELVELVGEE